MIDFGLSQNTIKPEDHAVDLRLIKEILNSAHAKIMQSCWKNFLAGYKSVVGVTYQTKIVKLVSDIENKVVPAVGHIFYDPKFIFKEAKVIITLLSNSIF